MLIALERIHRPEFMKLKKPALSFKQGKQLVPFYVVFSMTPRESNQLLPHTFCLLWPILWPGQFKLKLFSTDRPFPTVQDLILVSRSI